MRYLVFLFLLISFGASAQIRDYQIKSDSPYDTLWVLTNDTATASPTYKLGYWRNARDLVSGYNDTDWLRYRTHTIPNNSDTMYHTGITSIGPLVDTITTWTGMLNLVGRWDMRFPTGNAHNVAIGRNAGGTSLGINGHSIAIGDSTLFNAGSAGLYNVAIGTGAIKSSTSRYNTAIGYQSLYSGSGGISGGYSTAIGFKSGFSSSLNAVQNTIIGANAGYSNTSGDRNIFIGYNSGYDETNSDRLYIEPTNSASPLIFGNFAADSVLINGELGYTTTAGTATSVSGRNGTQFTNVGTGWGIDLVSGNLVVDSSQVATQYDLTTISGGSNDHDWYEVGGTTPPDNIDDNMFSGTGNHGIGTTSPAKPLHVVGEARITGSGGTATTITGRDTDEDITDVTTGWGIDLTGGALIVDSTEVATQYDLTLVAGGGMTNWLLAASGTGGTEEVNNAETVTITGGSGISATRSAANVTIAATDASTTNEAWTADADDADTELITNQTVKFEGAGIVTTDYVPASDKFIITGTEVDGSITNEGYNGVGAGGASSSTITSNTSGANDITVTVAGIMTISESVNSNGGIINLSATEVDGSTTNELNVIEENNATVQSGNTNIDFQSMFDVATDGAGEVNVSFDGGEATTVTTPEADDYVLMNDAGLAQNQKILWSDLAGDILTFLEDNVSEGTGSSIDFGTGMDLAVVGNEGNITLDFNEFTTDAATEGDEYVILYDPSAATQEKVLITSFGGDGNGLFDAANDGGTVPTDMDVLITDHIDFEGGLLYIDNTNNRIGVNTATPATDLNVVGVTRLEATASSAQNLYLVGKSDGGGVNIGETFIRMNYVDADYASGAEQAAVNMTLGKYSDLAQWSVFKIIMPEATDADILIGEKNADFSNNTAESHVLINGGIAFAQNYEWTGAGADLTLDRSYYNVSVSGAGAIGDEIFLPEINASLAGTDNWDGLSITAAQCQVGQVYTITNFRASTNLVVKPATGDLIKTGTSITLTPNQSVRIEAVRLSGTVGYWAYWLSD